MADDGGLSRFQKRMRSIPQAVREAVKPAVVTGAEEVASLARQLAPEDTGDLKKSIVVSQPGQATPPYSQPGGSRTAGPLEALVTAGNTDVRYPHLVEYGTTKTHAHPFFWPAFRLSRKRAATRIKGAISRAVRKHWGGK